ncbi:MAG TPA: EF-hand domain-containing protein, partial [Lentisphaeria bacterium]|nr:EF-hand domain-containing protein [Lentisphaeria bacterium]
RQRGPEARERRGPEARERRGQAGERREGQAPGAGLARFDKNQDGVVTRDELPADRPRMAEMFDRLDANKDGKLDQDELKGGRAPGNRGGERRRHQAEGEPAGIKAD